MSVGAASIDLAIMAKEMFGLKFKIVTGYRASNDVKLAMERGEIEGTFGNGWSSIKTAEPEWLAQKKIRIIVQHGFKKLPDLPDVPQIFELAQNEADRQALVFALARQEAAKPYFAPPEVPPARLAVLRRAFDAAVRDPKFIALATKTGVTLDGPMSGDELATLVATVWQTPPEVVSRVNRMLTEKKSLSPTFRQTSSPTRRPQAGRRRSPIRGPHSRHYQNDRIWDAAKDVCMSWRESGDPRSLLSGLLCMSHSCGRSHGSLLSRGRRPQSVR